MSTQTQQPNRNGKTSLVRILILTILTTLIFYVRPSHGWISTSFSSLSSTTTTSSLSGSDVSSKTTRLYNIPPPSTEDVVAYKEFASKQPPPSSFYELQQDCIRSTKLAIQDGIQLLEVEFPPLPATVLELDDVSAYDVAQANVKLAIDFCRGFTNNNNNSGENRKMKVAIMLPDEVEAKIALEKWTGLPPDQVGSSTMEVEDGITISSLRRSEVGDDRLIKVRTSYVVVVVGPKKSCCCRD